MTIEPFIYCFLTLLVVNIMFAFLASIKFIDD